jgi:tRNA uridine 5-carboxymethylaminomethyl modification enzyme
MYSGVIKAAGPRYCPSIEDKVVRFSEKPRHQLFLEPEGLDTDEYYINGFSSSLPEAAQLKALRTVPGLEKVEMNRPGYAIEYDFFPPHQLHITLESKIVPNLYFAGQVNGTSGYEEAAAQGLMAGINAVLKSRDEKPFRLSRSEAYIGVLLDDLVTKSTEEPYRMFTSRAEYRLKLRDDNADERLLEKGHALGLVADAIRREFDSKQVIRENLARFLRDGRIEVVDNGNNCLRKISAYDAIRNSGLNIRDFPIFDEAEARFGVEILTGLANDIRYEGYIRRQDRRIERFLSLEEFRIPDSVEYSNLKGLKREAKEKLSRFRPETLGQASRISGVSPGDISVLMVQLQRV